MYACEECERLWPTPSAADACAEMDRAEDYDAKHGRILRMHRDD